MLRYNTKTAFMCKTSSERTRNTYRNDIKRKFLLIEKKKYVKITVIKLLEVKVMDQGTGVM